MSTARLFTSLSLRSYHGLERIATIANRWLVRRTSRPIETPDAPNLREALQDRDCESGSRHARIRRPPYPRQEPMANNAHPTCRSVCAGAAGEGERRRRVEMRSRFESRKETRRPEEAGRAANAFDDGRSCRAHAARRTRPAAIVCVGYQLKSAFGTRVVVGTAGCARRTIRPPRARSTRRGSAMRMRRYSHAHAFPRWPSPIVIHSRSSCSVTPRGRTPARPGRPSRPAGASSSVPRYRAGGRAGTQA